MPQQAFHVAILIGLPGGTEVLEARDKLCTAAESVAVEGDLLAVYKVVRRAGRNRTVAVSRDRATACVPDACHRYALDLEIGGGGTDHFATMRCGIA
jgi:hypothetical protein